TKMGVAFEHLCGSIKLVPHFSHLFRPFKVVPFKGSVRGNHLLSDRPCIFIDTVCFAHQESGMVPQEESDAFIDGVEHKKARNKSDRANAIVQSDIPSNSDDVLLHPAKRSFLSCLRPCYTKRSP